MWDWVGRGVPGHNELHSCSLSICGGLTAVVSDSELGHTVTFHIEIVSVCLYKPFLPAVVGCRSVAWPFLYIEVELACEIAVRPMNLATCTCYKLH